jgi:hypothetical protein
MRLYFRPAPSILLGVGALGHQHSDAAWRRRKENQMSAIGKSDWNQWVEDEVDRINEQVAPAAVEESPEYDDAPTDWNDCIELQFVEWNKNV